MSVKYDIVDESARQRTVLEWQTQKATASNEAEEC